MVLAAERLLADVARVRPLVGVRALVDQQVVALGEAALAVLADELLLRPLRPAAPPLRQLAGQELHVGDGGRGEHGQRVEGGQGDEWLTDRRLILLKTRFGQTREIKAFGLLRLFFDHRLTPQMEREVWWQQRQGGWQEQPLVGGQRVEVVVQTPEVVEGLHLVLERALALHLRV